MNKSIIIPRDNLLITLSISILYLLEFEFQKEKGAFKKELNQYINRTQSQIGEAIRKLEFRGYIKKEKIGREMRFYITPSGTEFITNYHLLVKDQIIDFYKFIIVIIPTIKFNEDILDKIDCDSAEDKITSDNKVQIQNDIEDQLKILLDTNRISHKQMIKIRDSLVQVFIDNNH